MDSTIIRAGRKMSSGNAVAHSAVVWYNLLKKTNEREGETMQEIRCPHCGEVFQVDETGYAQIARQVRDSEFDKELRRREQELLARQASELDLVKLQQGRAYDKTLAEKDAALAQKAQEVEQLRAQLDYSETVKKLAVAEAVQRQAQALSEGEKRI